MNVQRMFVSRTQRSLLEAVSRLAYCNPFLPERVAGERAVLGAEFVEGEPVWSYRADRPGARENVWRIYRRIEPVAVELRSRLRAGVEPREPELVLYEDCVLHMLYTRYYRSFYEAAFTNSAKDARWRFSSNFLADWRHFLQIDGVRFPSGHDPCHTFACFRQIQRAFEYVFRD